MAEMKNTMKALIAYAAGDYRVEQIPMPKANEGEIVIKVEAAGICAGDVKTFQGGGMWNGWVKAPIVPGHEFFGTIVEMGPGVKGDFKIGDRVTSEQIVPCWECKNCMSGKYWQCSRHDIYGYRLNGGMSEYMKFPKESLTHKIPKELPLESAVLIEPFSCSKHAVDNANIGNEDIVVLSGAGALGLGMLGVIKLRNPKQVIVLDMKEYRLDLAKGFGADVVLNPAKVDVVAKVMELTDGVGCDVYIEATGYPASVIQGLAMIKKLGTFVEFGVFKEPVLVDWSIIGDFKELKIFGSHLGPYCYEPVIEWMGNGKLPTKGVVTHKFSLDDWKQAYETAMKTDEAIKVVFIP